MRIFIAEEKTDYVYIQLGDIRYIGARDDIETPRALLKEAWESGYNSINDENKNDFIKIENDDLIDFIMRLNCLVDYDQIRNLSIKRLDEIRTYLYTEQDGLRSKLGVAKETEKQSLLTGINDLEHKQFQIQEFMFYKSGILGIDTLILPEGIKYPTKGRSLKYILDKRKYDKEHNKKAA